MITVVKKPITVEFEENIWLWSIQFLQLQSLITYAVVE